MFVYDVTGWLGDSFFVSAIGSVELVAVGCCFYDENPGLMFSWFPVTNVKFAI